MWLLPDRVPAFEGEPLSFDESWMERGPESSLCFRVSVVQSLLPFWTNRAALITIAKDKPLGRIA